MEYFSRIPPACFVYAIFLGVLFMLICGDRKLKRDLRREVLAGLLHLGEFAQKTRRALLHAAVLPERCTEFWEMMHTMADLNLACLNGGCNWRKAKREMERIRSEFQCIKDAAEDDIRNAMLASSEVYEQLIGG